MSRSGIVIRKITNWAGITGLLIGFVISSIPVPAAFATNPATHNIASCAALQALGSDSSAVGDTINLAADLDCSGIANFTPLFTGDIFTGTFDGHGHSISHLTINHPNDNLVGLFARAESGATLENVVLASGSVAGLNDVGALVGVAGSVTISNITSKVDVTSEEEVVGGLIGYDNGSSNIHDIAVTASVDNPGDNNTGGFYVGGIIGRVNAGNGVTTTIERVSYTGNVTASAGSRIGGLFGAVTASGFISPASVTITDAYAAGTVNTSDNEVGGIMGSAIALGNGGPGTTIDVRRVYSSNAVTGTDGVGGIFGIDNSHDTGDAISLEDSFAVGAITDTVDHGGGIVGAQDADGPTPFTISGLYYDGPGTTKSVCTNDLTPTGTCARIDTGAHPNYFKGNHANAPLNSWNFSSVWTTRTGNYPILIPVDDGDNIAQAVELAAPNSGDANGDGTTDAAQANVSSFVDPVSGKYVSVAVSSSCSNTAASAAAESSEAAQDIGYDYPAGLVSFSSDCGSSGFTATVTLYFYGTTGLVARKYNPTTHGYSAIPGATVTATTIGGQSVAKVSYSITDGGPLDADSTANGIIVDPVGLGQAAVGVPDTGLGGLHRF